MRYSSGGVRGCVQDCIPVGVRAQRTKARVFEGGPLQSCPAQGDEATSKARETQSKGCGP